MAFSGKISKSGRKALRPKKFVGGIPTSLMDRIQNDSDSFCKGLRNNRQITDYQSFLVEFRKHLDKTPNGRDVSGYFFSDLDQELLRTVWRSKTIKGIMESNVGIDEAKKLYQQEEQSTIPTIITAPPISVPTIPKQSVHQHIRAGIQIKGYARMTPRKFTAPQIDFLKNMRGKKILTPRQVISQYRMAFSQDDRSDISVRTKFYRM